MWRCESDCFGRGRTQENSVMRNGHREALTGRKEAEGRNAYSSGPLSAWATQSSAVSRGSWVKQSVFPLYSCYGCFLLALSILAFY